jgi:hypothetical protein
MSLTLVEGKRIRVSYVIEPNDHTKDDDFPMCLGYLDGKISGAVIYGKNDEFISGGIEPKFIIDSTYADISVYGIRMYNRALTHMEIRDNYIASLPTIEKKEELYKSN